MGKLDSSHKATSLHILHLQLMYTEDEVSMSHYVRTFENIFYGAMTSFSWFIKHEEERQTEFQNFAYMICKENKSSETKFLSHVLGTSLKFRWTFSLVENCLQNKAVWHEEYSSA